MGVVDAHRCLSVNGSVRSRQGNGCFACRPFPEGQWCNIDHDAYRPGTGWAWRDAWIPY